MENIETKAKISKETANRDFESWADALGIEYDMDGMNAEEKADFERIKAPIIKAIVDGRCVVDGNSLEYTIKTCVAAEGLAGRNVKIGAPSGAIYSGMDGYKETQNVHRLNGAMSAMTGLDVGIFPKLDLRDYSFFKAVVQLFLSI